MWERWRQGWTLHEIGKLFDRAHSSIQGIFAPTGGIRPPERSRALTTLTLAIMVATRGSFSERQMCDLHIRRAQKKCVIAVKHRDHPDTASATLRMYSMALRYGLLCLGHHHPPFVDIARELLDQIGNRSSRRFRRLDNSIVLSYSRRAVSDARTQ